MGKYAEQDIMKLLTYGCNFIMIDAPRSVGKTYSTLKIIIRYCLKNNMEFAYICRTVDEKNKGVMQKAVQKVMQNEFASTIYECSNEYMFVLQDDKKKTLAYCLALSESQKIKKYSYPKCRFMIFDEYMLETGGRYVNGIKEPDLLLNIYHTIDREEDRVTCFLLGNNTNFYNPYHMHKAFRIPYVERGKVYRGNNVVFASLGRSEELNADKQNCKFLQMIQGSEYGEYANAGSYGDTHDSFIMKRPEKATQYVVLFYSKSYYGVWMDIDSGMFFIDDKYNSNSKYVYAATDKDITENIIRSKGITSQIKDMFYKGRCRFTSKEIRTKFTECIPYL